MYPTDIKKIIKGYYKQFYANKFENLDAMDQSLKNSCQIWPKKEYLNKFLIKQIE